MIVLIQILTNSIVERPFPHILTITECYQYFKLLMVYRQLKIYLFIII